MRYLCLAIGLLWLSSGWVQAQDRLSRDASWEIPGKEEFEKRVLVWLDHEKPGDELKLQVLNLIESNVSDELKNRLELVLDLIQIVKPEFESIRISASKPRHDLEVPNFSSVFGNPNEHAFVISHTRLLAGRWFVQNEMYDEALDELGQLALTDVLDPATLLFSRALAQHQILKRDDCLATIDKMLEHEHEIPRRYLIVGKLMAADLKPLESDSLNEVSRIMNDIRRRQSLYRSGKIVRSQEEEVIEKLDKLIEDLEAQRQQQMEQASSSSGPSTPMQDSRRAPGLGSGEVANEEILEGGQWGDLPPAERAAALAEMAKDLPPHYRAVIEEYFRQLAREQDQ